MLPERVTAKYLSSLGACGAEVARFRTLHRRGLTLSWLSCQAAASERFDLDWFARQALSAPARKAYQEATATACWQAIQKAIEEAES